MTSTVPDYLRPYLKPLLDRIQALEKKNELLETEMLSLKEEIAMHHPPPPQPKIQIQQKQASKSQTSMKLSKGQIQHPSTTQSPKNKGKNLKVEHDKKVTNVKSSTKIVPHPSTGAKKQQLKPNKKTQKIEKKASNAGKGIPQKKIDSQPQIQQNIVPAPLEQQSLLSNIQQNKSPKIEVKSQQSKQQPKQQHQQLQINKISSDNNKNNSPQTKNKSKRQITSKRDIATPKIDKKQSDSHKGSVKGQDKNGNKKQKLKTQETHNNH